ncbi:MAG: Gldg family protein [Saccharofermentanales bacterium]
MKDKNYKMNSNDDKDNDAIDSAKATKKKKTHAVDKRNKNLRIVSVSSVVLFLAIVLVFNIVFDSFLGSKLRWDWSQTDLFTVGEVTGQLVADLDKDIKIIGLYEKGTAASYADIEILIEKYVDLSDGRITVQYIDPVKTPSIITQVDPDGLLKPVAQDFVVWCEANKKAKVLGMYDLYKIGYNETTYAQEIQGVTAEQALSGAIRYTASEETPVVYMTKGHGEADYTESFTSMLALIQNNNFLVKDLDMLVSTEIPDDARLIIMLNPSSDINAGDREKLDGYLKKGRSLLVMTEFSSASFPVLNDLLSNYNIEISDNRVREGEMERRYQNDPYVFVTDLPAGSIAEEAMPSGTLLQNARAIMELKNSKEWIVVEPFLQTGESGLIEEKGDPEKTGAAGVVSIGLACENSGFIDGTNVTDPTRILVVGASSFMGDSIISTFGSQVYNMYSFYYGLNWLVDLQSDELMITAKELPSYALTGGGNTAFWIATIVCIIVIPLGLLITALVVYRRRKNM